MFISAGVLNHSSKRHDARTRHDRTEQRNKAWAAQLDALVAAYLTWQANAASSEPEQCEGTPFDITVVDFFGTHAGDWALRTPR